MKPSMSEVKQPGPVSGMLLGRTFLSPAFDYLLIGGGLSLLVVVILLLVPSGYELVTAETLPYFFLLCNSAHFASSTVRLYTKPGACHSMPNVAMVLPLLAFLVLALCMFQADTLGPQLNAIYLTWSPFHYAAQAYGLSIMYCYRSGCLLGVHNKRLLWWVSMVPFFHNFMTGPKIGLHWIDVYGWLDGPLAIAALRWFWYTSPVLGVFLIGYVFWRIRRTEARPMPIISVMALVANSVWWFVLPPLDAFVWATIFHGVQYLAIVIIFHVKDQLARDGNRRGPIYHVVKFYGLSLLLGYGLFNCFPEAFLYAGFGRAESALLTVAVINIHHFIVDAYIWRLKNTDTNRRIVDTGVPA